MRERVIQNLNAHFGAYADLIRAVGEADLGASVDVPEHKTLGAHLWCIVGSRESYAKALRAGAWDGFDNSMTEYSRAAYEKSLDATAQDLRALFAEISDWTPARDDLLASLYEHEVMHGGQIIRHMYALGKTLPPSWRWA